MIPNAGELRRGAERGNLPAIQRLGGRKSNQGTLENSDLQNFENIMFSFYLTQLRLAAINLIRAQGTFPDKWKVNWSLLETMIRQGFLVAVGRDGFGNFRILNSQNLSINMGLNAYMGIGFTPGAGVIHDELSDTDLYPITDLNPDEGDYVIFSNKNIVSYLNFDQPGGFEAALNLSGMSDEDLMWTTASRLAANKASAYQNMLQMRSSTIYATKNKNITGGNITQRWLNGYPVMGVETEGYDVTNSITTLQGSSNLANFMEGLRMESDSLIGEHGMWLGLSSLGAIKQSGISDMEAASKLQIAESMAAIYLQARQDPLNRLVRRFPDDFPDGLTAMFNQESAKAILQQMKTQAAQLEYETLEAQAGSEAIRSGKLDPVAEATNNDKNDD